jgi:hypothetical protein
MIACRQRSPTSRTASESSRRRTQRNLARGSNDQRNSALQAGSARWLDAQEHSGHNVGETELS